MQRFEDQATFYGWENYVCSRHAFVSFDGTEIAYRRWQGLKKQPFSLVGRKKEPGRVALIIHGWNEHSGCYNHTTSWLVSLGFTVYGIDLRGHGNSGGRRGHVEQFNDYSQDCLLMLRAIRTEIPRSQIHILAHSMGGLVATRMIQNMPPGPEQERLRSLILSGPLFELASGLSGPRRAFGGMMNRVWSTAPVRVSIAEDELTSDKTRYPAYKNDGLRHHTVTPRWFVEMNRARSEALADAHFMTLPVLVLHGGRDRVNDLSGSRKFYDALRSQKKELHIFRAMQHEILNEAHNMAVYKQISRWLQD